MLGPTRDSGMSCPITWEDKFALSKLNRVLMAMLNLRIRNAHCRDMWSPDLRVCVLHWGGAGGSHVALVVKKLPASAGDIRDLGLIPGLAISPGGRHGKPLQYSCLENSMGRGAWQATVYGVTELDTTKRLST